VGLDDASGGYQMGGLSRIFIFEGAGIGITRPHMDSIHNLARGSSTHFM